MGLSRKKNPKCTVHFFLAALFMAPMLPCSFSFSCLDESGSFIDFFAAIKENDGISYYYTDPDQATLKNSSYNMESVDEGAIISTINQFYGDLGTSFAYAMYNDETPEGQTTNDRAHSKGLLLFNGDMGFWMIHSFPLWPGAVADGYDGLSSTTYAQSFMCTTFRLDKLEAIAKIQMVHWPLIYSSGISSDLVSTLPNFASWIGGAKNETAISITTDLLSYNGRHMTHYGKSRYCDCDLWGDIVAPGIKSNMRVETWQKGANYLKMPDFCAPEYEYSVVNVSSIQMGDGYGWGETSDHSKWGVSEEAAETVCIGDINRQYSQESRGGGVLCYPNKALWSTFDSAVNEVYDCADDK